MNGLGACRNAAPRGAPPLDSGAARTVRRRWSVGLPLSGCLPLCRLLHLSKAFILSSSVPRDVTCRSLEPLESRASKARRRRKTAPPTSVLPAGPSCVFRQFALRSRCFARHHTYHFFKGTGTLVCSLAFILRTDTKRDPMSALACRASAVVVVAQSRSSSKRVGGYGGNFETPKRLISADPQVQRKSPQSRQSALLPNSS